MRFWTRDTEGLELVPPSSDSPKIRYRATHIGRDGSIISTDAIIANGDEDATEKARALVDAHSVDLWDGMRFVEHFPVVAGRV